MAFFHGRRGAPPVNFLCIYDDFIVFFIVSERTFVIYISKIVVFNLIKPASRDFFEKLLFKAHFRPIPEGCWVVSGGSRYPGSLDHSRGSPHQRTPKIHQWLPVRMLLLSLTYPELREHVVLLKREAVLAIGVL